MNSVSSRAFTMPLERGYIAMKNKSKAAKAKRAKAKPRDLATKINRTFRDDICNIITRGELLQQAKDQIEHGVWLTWLEANFNWDAQTAQRATRQCNANGEWLAARLQ